jgi:hypothetical protein
MVEMLRDIDFQDKLEVALSRAFEELQNEISEPLPEDRTERCKHQETLISQAFQKIEDVVVNVCRTWKIPEDNVRAAFDKVKPHLIRALLIVGK